MLRSSLHRCPGPVELQHLGGVCGDPPAAAAPAGERGDRELERELRVTTRIDERARESRTLELLQ